MNYRINLWEDEIEWDENRGIIHHPLNSRYFVRFGEDTVSYGYLTFGGHDLDKSSLLGDIKVFYLEFQGEPDDINNREEWADPLRAEVLLRLSDNNRSWYLSLIDINLDETGDMLIRILAMKFKQIEVQSERPFGDTYGFMPRQFFEVPNNHLSKIVPHFWSRAMSDYPIEGYNMEAGQIEVLRQWDARLRDDQLFREVIDRTFINFYTFPAEHRNFVFVTNKLNYAELASLIGLEELQEQAKEMGKEMK